MAVAEQHGFIENRELTFREFLQLVGNALVPGAVPEKILEQPGELDAVDTELGDGASFEFAALWMLCHVFGTLERQPSQQGLHRPIGFATDFLAEADREWTRPSGRV